jgi:tetratricopeptide (TPR) repeat protein
VGAVHEYPVCSCSGIYGKLDSVNILSLHDGNSWSDPNKYRRYALMFENELLKCPTEPRNVFYMAQCYKDCGDTQRAIEGYEARCKLAGWQDEVWYSLY